jgi:GGDEF domain-containing protein
MTNPILARAALGHPCIRASAELLVRRLRDAFGDPLIVRGTTMALTMSIGIGSVDGGADPADAYQRVVREP